MAMRRKRLPIAVAAVGFAILALAAAARTVLPHWLRGTVERVVREAIGRDLEIAGDFDLSLGLTSRLVAGDVTLANAPWGSEPFTVRAGRVMIAVDLRSLWFRPVRVRDVEIDDARVFLERDREGRASWAFDVKPASGPPITPAAQPPFRIDHAAIRRLALVYRGGVDARPLTIGVADLEAGIDPATGKINLRGEGHFNDAPWDLAGWLASFDNLVEGHDVDQALTGHIGQAAIMLRGHIQDPLTLGGPNVEVNIDGPDVVSALAVLGLETRLTGPFRVHGVADPVDGGIGIDASAAVGDLATTASGTVSAILDPTRIDLTVTAAGPDAAFVGLWLGVDHLPRRSFNLTGRLRRDGPKVSCESLKVRVGATSLVVDGTFGAPPRGVGTDLRVSATGANLAELSTLTGLRLPAFAFEVSGRFLRRANGLAIQDVKAKVGGASIEAAGTIGEPPRFETLDLTADLSGPDASWLSGIARVELPKAPFEVRGRVALSGTAIELHDVSGRLGGAAFDVTGRVVPVPGLAGSEGSLHLAGDDLATIASFAGVRGAPGEPFRLDGHVLVSPDGYVLDDVDAQIGSVSAKGIGHLGAPSITDGTSFTGRVHGPVLSSLAAWGIERKLPSDPFAVAGSLRIDGGVYRVLGVSAEIGANHLAIDGTLGAIPDTSSLDIAVEASGPSLAGIVQSFTAADAARWQRIAAEPYTLAGRVSRVPSGFAIHEAKAKVGNTSMTASGTLTLGERLLGTDITLDVQAPDALILSRLVGTPLPDQAVHARGRVVRVENGFRLDDTSVTIGPSYADISGILGEPPRFTRTELDVSALGPDLAATLGPITGLAPLPIDSFELSAHVSGNSERIDSDRFTARLGNSDLDGTLSVVFGSKPVVDANLRSKQIGATRLIAGFSARPDADEGAAAPKAKPRGKKDRVISDQPLSLGALRGVDGHLRLSAAALTFTGLPLRDVAIEGELRNGTVTIGRFEGTGENGGHMTAGFSLEPIGDGYRVRTAGHLDGARLALMNPGESATSAPSIDIEYDLSGTGRSLHEIAASSNGWALLMMGPGRVPNTFGGFATSDVLIALMDALNPFRKSSPYTTIECGVAAAGIEAGEAIVSPIAVRSDKLTVLGNGKLNFETEAISLEWTLKPRRGIGISGGSIANPYIKLDGTLASPTLDLKPLQAVVSTGAAVATAGLTLLFRGIYDRITAEKQVCDEALIKARKRIDANTASAAP